MFRRAAGFASCLLMAAPALAQHFATTGGGGTNRQSLLALSSTTGQETFLGSNPGVIVHDFTSPPVPALTIPALSSVGLALLSLGLLALALRRLRP